MQKSISIVLLMLPLSLMAGFVSDPLAMPWVLASPQQEIAPPQSESSVPPVTTDVNALQNGDFSSGLSSWSSSGDVTVASAAAIVGDNQQNDSLLYQLVPLAPGTYVVSWDMNPTLSSSAPSGSFLDTFYATLYFANNPATFNIVNGQFDNSATMLNMDSGGPFSSTVTLTPSTTVPGWQTATLTFNNTYAYIAVSFELINLNNVSNDSNVQLDNVTISAVPEPRTAALASVAIALLLVRRSLNKAGKNVA